MEYTTLYTEIDRQHQLQNVGGGIVGIDRDRDRARLLLITIKANAFCDRNVSNK